MGIHSWQDLPLDNVTPFKSYRTFKGDKIKVLFLTLKPGHIGEKHKHQSEQISSILRGKIKIRLGGEERIVQKGDLIHIPENQPHQTESLGEEAVILEIFSPAEYQKVTCE